MRFISVIADGFNNRFLPSLYLRFTRMIARHVDGYSPLVGARAVSIIATLNGTLATRAHPETKYISRGKTIAEENLSLEERKSKSKYLYLMGEGCVYGRGTLHLEKRNNNHIIKENDFLDVRQSKVCV